MQLTIWSNEALQSAEFEGFYLSDLEYGLKAFHDQIRRLLPVSTVQERPLRGQRRGAQRRSARTPFSR